MTQDKNNDIARRVQDIISQSYDHHISLVQGDPSRLPQLIAKELEEHHRKLPAGVFFYEQLSDDAIRIHYFQQSDGRTLLPVDSIVEAKDVLSQKILSYIKSQDMPLGTHLKTEHVGRREVLCEVIDPAGKEQLLKPKGRIIVEGRVELDRNEFYTLDSMFDRYDAAVADLQPDFVTSEAPGLTNGTIPYIVNMFRTDTTE